MPQLRQLPLYQLAQWLWWARANVYTCFLTHIDKSKTFIIRLISRFFKVCWTRCSYTHILIVILTTQISNYDCYFCYLGKWTYYTFFTLVLTSSLLLITADFLLLTGLWASPAHGGATYFSCAHPSPADTQCN